ncbi:hypothetical protein BX616_009112, partial [Lobosporangium transversale]
YSESTCVMRMQASEPKSMNLKVSLKSHQENNLEYTNIHNRLGFRAQLQSNNMIVEAQVAVKAEGATGVSMSNSREVIVLGFDTVTLYYSLGTNWDTNEYPTFRGKDPHVRLLNVIDKALSMFYNDQLQKYLQEYQALFRRFELDLGQPATTQLATDELVEASRHGKAKDEDESYLDGLITQYGRYLLISSSHIGSLPVSGRHVWGADEEDGKLVEDSP